MGKGQLFTQEKRRSGGVFWVAVVLAAVFLWLGPMQTAARAAEEGDLTPYITNVTVKDQSGKEKTTFKDGDQIHIGITLAVPKGSLDPSRRTLVYQLPNHLVPAKTLTTSFEDRNGNVTGQLTVDTSGKVTAVFAETYNWNNDYVGNIFVDGTVDLDGSREDSSSTFKIQNDGEKTIQLQAQRDISVDKTGQYDANDKKIHYTVTVSTQNGTRGRVDLIDTIRDYTNGTVAFDGSVQLQKKDAAGNLTSVAASPQFGSEAWTSHPQMRLDDLPELKAGESYVLKYGVEASVNDGTNGAMEVYNRATTNDEGGNGGGKDSHVSVSKEVISKTGNFNTATGFITWTVTFNNDGGGRALEGYAFSDDLGGKGLTLTGPAVLKGYENWGYNKVIREDIGKKGDTGIGFTFSDKELGNEPNARYQLTYTTTAPKGNESVTNTGIVRTPNNETYQAKSQVGVWHREVDVSKNARSVVQPPTDGGETTFNWRSTVTLPETAVPSTGYLYTDTIHNATDASGKDQGKGSHYALAGELNNRIPAGTFIDQNGKEQKITDYFTVALTCYDADGNKVDASDLTVPVMKFEAKFTPKGNVIGRELYVNYSTHGKTDFLAEGDNAYYPNDGEVGDRKTTGTGTYKRPKENTVTETLDKQIGIKDNQGNINYNSAFDTQEMTYTDQNNRLYYRVLLQLDKDTAGALSMQDILPKGVHLDKDSIKAGYYFANGGYPYILTTNWVNHASGSYTYDFNDNKKPIVESRSLPDGTTALNVVIQDDYRSDDANDPMIIAIDYSVTVDEDVLLENIQTGNNTYVNTASWKGHTDKTRTKVDVNTVEKTAEQVKSGDTFHDAVDYSVVINPAAKDLAAGEMATATDTLSNLPQGIKAYLDMNHTALYEYSATAEDHKGEEIDPSRYQIQYDDAAHKITLTYPDETALVFSYRYDFSRSGDQTYTDPTINNTVTISGKNTHTSENTIPLRHASGSGALYDGVLTVYKVDSSDMKIHLPGAQFDLEMQNGSAFSKVGNYTTDSEGKLTLKLISTSSNDALLENTLYRLVEAEAPAHYRAGGPTYLAKLSSDQTESGFYNALPNEIKSQVKQTDIHFYQAERATIYIPNDYTAIKVNKAWTDQDNTEAPPGSHHVTVNLHQYVTTGKDVTVTVNFKDSWGHFVGTRQYRVGDGKSITFRWHSDDIGKYYHYTGEYDWQNVKNVEKREDGDYYYLTYSNVTQDMNIEIISGQGNDGSYHSVAMEEKGDKGLHVTAESNIKRREVTTYSKTLILNSDNGWSAIVTDLPKTDPEGNPYTYTVTEDAVPGYTAAYQNNGGIQTGTINITNKDNGQHGYLLPGTGGVGIWPFVIGGFGMAVFSLMALSIKEKRKQAAQIGNSKK